MYASEREVEAVVGERRKPHSLLAKPYVPFFCVLLLTRQVSRATDIGSTTYQDINMRLRSLIMTDTVGSKVKVEELRLITSLAGRSAEENQEGG